MKIINLLECPDKGSEQCNKCSISECASSSGTSGIATAPSSVGKMQRRGNIFAGEASKNKVPASTPRNFVAKNAKTGGAGAHKDKKKEQKQGNVKHKKPYMEDLKDRLDNLKSNLDNLKSKLAEGEFWGNNKMANAANQASSSTATVRNKDEKGTYTSTMHRKKGESDHKEVSRKYDNEKKVSERDDREDDEHGGGPTPWENPDKGWAPKKVKEAAKWRQGYSASGHPAGHKHKSGEVGPVGGTFTNEPSGYDGETSKVPVQKHRDQPDQLASRGDTKVSTSGKPLLPRNAQKNLKHAIQQSKGKHGPVGDLPEGYKVVPGIDKERYQERPGLEGPFHTESGKVVYYDKREGKYYDPDSDFYISHDDWQAMNQGVAEGSTPGYIKYEQMKDKIAGVLIKLYDQGKDAETIQQMGARVAKHLGYDPEDSIYQDAWSTSFNDASLDGSFDQGSEDDYTDYSMRQGEMGRKGVAEGIGDTQQGYKVVAVRKSDALKKPTKLTVKAGSIEEVFERLAINDWYALSINGVEVIAGKRLKQDVAEGGYPEVDHMPGKRGIGLDSAKPRDTYIKTFHASKEKEAQEFAKKNGYIVKKHVYPKSANNSQPYEFQVHKNEQGVAEGSEIKIPTEDGITMQDIRLMAGEGPLTKKTVRQAIEIIRKQRRPQGVAEGEKVDNEHTYESQLMSALNMLIK
jgi:hypothetical protein